ncbi:MULTISPECIES: sigma factor-binding protein Crl [Photobacterium]|uniref:Sigma factor-binding protein Crl n=1 Tax=Photobacterium ganghwense TaxID=320778 RepID=A0A0J1HHI4_9GAMM|nr:MULTISPECIES: sigma factor-binding protein Crl [Photobacterium]KLV11063.1 XRE family transcriptional regulator [Photobacterium ganghwense]MBV1840423.1 sigma factor-binding protein Crl [Photobacterium ganghwense]PSU11328.1 Crl family RNA polymerase assembly factor [Photobacterium ganghwense]QSV13453.1 sigma factor-binding protein Crl [Photobacterium ganghwense]
MTTQVTFPPHGRLMTKLTALGPYLRQNLSAEGHFFFDCLSSCISAKKAPEEREFWGWWLIMEATKNGFEYHYQFGRFNDQGEWDKDTVPAKHVQAVQQTLDDFYPKLKGLLVDELGLSLTASKALEEPELGSAA